MTAVFGARLGVCDNELTGTLREEAELTSGQSA
jgi:hypothetical protein